MRLPWVETEADGTETASGKLFDSGVNWGGSRYTTVGDWTGGWQTWNASKSETRIFDETGLFHDKTIDSYNATYIRDTAVSKDGSSSTDLIRNGGGSTNIDRMTDVSVTDQFQEGNVVTGNGELQKNERNSLETHVESRDFDYDDNVTIDIDAAGDETQHGDLNRSGQGKDTVSFAEDGVLLRTSNSHAAVQNDSSWRTEYDNSESTVFDDSFSTDTTLFTSGASETKSTYEGDGLFNADWTYDIDASHSSYTDPTSNDTASHHDDVTASDSFTYSYDTERNTDTSASGEKTSYGELKRDGSGVYDVSYFGDSDQDGVADEVTTDNYTNYSGGGTANHAAADDWKVLADGTGIHNGSISHDGNHNTHWDETSISTDPGGVTTWTTDENLFVNYDTSQWGHQDYDANGLVFDEEELDHTSDGTGDTVETWDTPGEVSTTTHGYDFTRDKLSQHDSNGLDTETDVIQNDVQGSFVRTGTIPASHSYSDTVSHLGFAELDQNWNVVPGEPPGHHFPQFISAYATTWRTVFNQFDEYAGNYAQPDWHDGLGANLDSNTADWAEAQSLVEVDDLSVGELRLRSAFPNAGDLSSEQSELSRFQKDLVVGDKREQIDAQSRFNDLYETFEHVQYGTSGPAFVGTDPWYVQYGVSHWSVAPNPDYDPRVETSLVHRVVDRIEGAYESGAVYEQTWAKHGGRPAETKNGLPPVQNTAQAITAVNAMLAHDVEVDFERSSESRKDDLERMLDTIFGDLGSQHGMDGHEFAEDLSGTYSAAENATTTAAQDSVESDIAGLLDPPTAGPLFIENAYGSSAVTLTASDGTEFVPGGSGQLATATTSATSLVATYAALTGIGNVIATAALAAPGVPDELPELDPRPTDEILLEEFRLQFIIKYGEAGQKLLDVYESKGGKFYIVYWMTGGTNVLWGGKSSLKGTEMVARCTSRSTTTSPLMRRRMRYSCNLSRRPSNSVPCGEH